MKKKNILLVIRRGQPELDWIAPLLFKYKKNHIYVFYLSKDAFKNFPENNPIFLIFKSICKGYFIQKLTTNFFWRLCKYFFGKKNQFLSSKIHDPKFLIKKLKIKGSIDIIFSEYGNNSEWIKSFINLKKKPLIINYPSSPLSFGQGFKEKHKKYYKKKLLCDYVFLILKRDLKYWSKSIENKKMLFFGNPAYDNWWINKISKFENEKFNNKKNILFAYNSDFGLIPKEQEKVFEQDLYFFMKTFVNMSSMKKIKLVFKIHPLRNNPYYLNILNKFPKHKWSVSKSPLILLSKKSRAMICTHGSAAILNGLYSKIPTMEYQRGFYKNSKFAEKSVTEIGGMSVVVKKNNLKKMLDKAIHNSKDNIWIKQKRKFNSVYKPKYDVSNKIFKFINNKLIKYEKL